MNAFEHAVARAGDRIGPAHLRMLAAAIADGRPRQAVLHAVPVPGFAEAARSILAGQRADGVPPGEAAAYLRGVAAGREAQAREPTVETVWSGPHTHAVPVRSTAQVLTGVVAAAERELLLVSYAATPYRPLLAALTAAVRRGVTVVAVVETLEGAAGALTGAEPGAAFSSVPELEIWHWPVTKRTENGAKMHAKIAVADRKVLLVSSANLTQSGVGRNIEAGVLIRGGTAPRRAAEHITELRARGVLERLR